MTAGVSIFGERILGAGGGNASIIGGGKSSIGGGSSSSATGGGGGSSSIGGGSTSTGGGRSSTGTGGGGGRMLTDEGSLLGESARGRGNAGGTGLLGERRDSSLAAVDSVTGGRMDKISISETAFGSKASVSSMAYAACVTVAKYSRFIPSGCSYAGDAALGSTGGGSLVGTAGGGHGRALSTGVVVSCEADSSGDTILGLGAGGGGVATEARTMDPSASLVKVAFRTKPCLGETGGAGLVLGLGGGARTSALREREAKEEVELA
jgi:hypothetical protein